MQQQKFREISIKKNQLVLDRVLPRFNILLFSCSKSNVFIQQIKLNKKLNNLLTTWNHISVQASVESLDYLYELKQKLLELHPGSWTKKLPMIEDTTLTIEIDSGTIDATEYNLAFHVQQLSSKIGIEKR